MNRYAVLSKFLNVAALSLSVATAIWVKEYLAVRHLHWGFEFLVVVLILGLGLAWLRIGFGTLIASMPGLRRWVLGDQFVDGTWIDVVRFADGTEFFGLVTIRPQGDALRLTVENADRDGKHLGSFSANQIKFDWPRVTFMAEASGPRPQYSGGIVALVFEERAGGAPKRFTGRCLDYKDPLPDALEGWKVEDVDDLEPLSDRDGRAHALRGVINVNAD